MPHHTIDNYADATTTTTTNPTTTATPTTDDDDNYDFFELPDPSDTFDSANAASTFKIKPTIDDDDDVPKTTTTNPTMPMMLTTDNDYNFFASVLPETHDCTANVASTLLHCSLANNYDDMTAMPPKTKHKTIVQQQPTLLELLPQL